MRSPKDMEIIQIDITNECVHRCSNCTRFCGHHKKPFYMDFDTFKKAVDSMDGYEGILGIIGGEPTIHPEFEKFAKYLGSKRLCKPNTVAREPIEQLLPYIEENVFLPLDVGCRAGLWSSLNKTYYKHFETINECFDYQALNDHNNTCMHQALLMSRKECGLSDEEWIPQRDNCWIQNTWSATITPKGCFFCEVAGSLDMLFDGPGGWPIEKGWWKRTPEDFKDQLHWCELCSCGFDVPTRLSTDGRDDVTPLIYEKLKAIGSPKALKGDVVVHTKEEYQKNKHSYKAFEKSNDYMNVNNSIRVRNSASIMPRSFEICKPSHLGKILSKKPKDWIIVSPNKFTALKLKKYLSNLIINPGCMYTYNKAVAFNVIATSTRDHLDDNTLSYENLFKVYPQDKIIPVKIVGKSIRLLRNIFSVANEYKYEKKYKVVKVLGVKISHRIKEKVH